MLFHATLNWRTPYYVFAIPGIILGIIALFLPDYKTVKKEGEALVSKGVFQRFQPAIQKSILVACDTQPILSVLSGHFHLRMGADDVEQILWFEYEGGGNVFRAIVADIPGRSSGRCLGGSLHKGYKNARHLTSAIAAFLIVVTGLVAMFTVGSVP